MKCGADLVQPATGRRKRYCGPGCRRAAEYELRRLQRHLESTEAELRALELKAAGWWPEYQRHQRDVLRQQIATLEDRLRALLTDKEGTP